MAISSKAKIIVVVFAATAILLSACDSKKSLSKLESDQEWCQQEVRKNLKDPDSANFKDVAARRYPEDKYSDCKGMVNAKNSMGGYTGFRKFTRYEDGSVYFSD